MMTVKYIDPHGGEQVFPVREVLWNNRCANGGQAGYAPAQGHVEFVGRPQRAYPEVAAVEHVYAGTVYVMNEAGKTVAKYELGGQKLEPAQAIGSTFKLRGDELITGASCTGYTSPPTT